MEFKMTGLALLGTISNHIDRSILVGQFVSPLDVIDGYSISLLR